jgi:protein gp37
MISAGCDHCYAMTVAKQKTRDLYLQQSPVKNTPINRADPFAPRFWDQRLDLPLHWKRPRRVFVNSMSDIFHAHFSRIMIERIFDVMNRAYWHQFQVLTKRPERALRLADHVSWSKNIWLGTSIENMDVSHRANTLRATPAAIKFVSAEPLLGSLDALDVTGIDWVIGGGESGRGYRPCNPEWARGLRDVCLRAGVAFFWKQWGGLTSKSGGRQLDGRVWDEYPLELASAADRKTVP